MIAVARGTAPDAVTVWISLLPSAIGKNVTCNHNTCNAASTATSNAEPRNDQTRSRMAHLLCPRVSSRTKYTSGSAISQRQSRSASGCRLATTTPIETPTRSKSAPADRYPPRRFRQYPSPARIEARETGEMSPRRSARTSWAAASTTQTASTISLSGNTLSANRRLGTYQKGNVRGRSARAMSRWFQARTAKRSNPGNASTGTGMQ